MPDEHLSRALFLRALAFALGGVLLWLLLARPAFGANWKVTFVNNLPVPQEIRVLFDYGTGDCCEGWLNVYQETMLVPAGGALTRTVSFPTPNPEENIHAGWRVFRLQSPDAVLVGNSYVGGSAPELVAIGGNGGNLPENNQEDIFIIPAGRQLNPDASKTLWQVSDSELTANVFREGIDKIIAFQKTPGSTEGGSPGSMPNTEATHTAAKEANQLVDFTELTPNASKAAMQSAGSAAGTEFQALVGTVPPSTGYALSPGGAPDLTVALPATFGGGTFDFNPFQSGRFAEICAWFRAATAWLTLALLAVWVWGQMAEWVRGFSTVRQARGNPVVLGTGAQATALAAAGLMTVAVVVAMTALVAWTFGDINVPALVGTVTTNPMATIPAGVLWMLDQVFPVATMIAALVARVTFNMYGSAVFGVCSSVVRFIVP